MSQFLLLSPANLNGIRGQRLFKSGRRSELAERVHSADGASVGEVFAHVSSLYFRGKLEYALHFAGAERTRVIVSGYGLVAPDWSLTLERAERVRDCPVDPREPGYREPLERDLRSLDAEQVVLMGSLASRKYLDVLVPLLGDRLHYPKVFLGCGDMRRGSLCLKAVESGTELEYTRWEEHDSGH